MTNERPEPQDAMFLGLGSNIGDRETHLRESTSRIERLGISVVRQSSIYETQPVGLVDQPWFLNQVIEINVRGCLKTLPFEETAYNDSEVLLPIKTAGLLCELL